MDSAPKIIDMFATPKKPSVGAIDFCKTPAAPVSVPVPYPTTRKPDLKTSPTAGSLKHKLQTQGMTAKGAADALKGKLPGAALDKLKVVRGVAGALKRR